MSDNKENTTSADGNEKSENNPIVIKPICTGCNKRPDELQEYIEMAEALETTPDEAVKSEDGTYNELNGHFLCTDCYIMAGMPSTDPGEHGWKAP